MSILAPVKGETINDDQPTFSGTGKPGEIITITIHSSQVVTAQVTVGQDGKWSYTPNQSLISGQHTITIASGSKQNSSTFTVLGAATPPATPVAGVSAPVLLSVIGGIFVLLVGILLSHLSIL